MKEVATLRRVSAASFANTSNGLGYDLVLLGQPNPRPINIDAVQARLSLRRLTRQSRSLSDILNLFRDRALCDGCGRKLICRWLSGAALNRDRNLRLQYLAGLGLNLYQSDAIYRNMT